MLAPMAKKKPKKPVRSGKPLHVWLDDALRDAIEEARRRSRRSLREEVSIALELYLKGLGLWSPPSDPPADPES
jgi:hypothetical protein